MKTLIATLSLTAILYFNWDKVPEPIQKTMETVLKIGKHVVKEGRDMPAPVKKYVDERINLNEKVAKYLKEK